ncbi:hypothetical protein ACFVZD_45195 [Streptomyces sp. NPDC058287]
MAPSTGHLGASDRAALDALLDGCSLDVRHCDDLTLRSTRRLLITHCS